MKDYHLAVNEAYVAMALIRLRIRLNDKALVAALLQISDAIELLINLNNEHGKTNAG